MSESELKILVVDTAAREAKLALLRYTQPLSVKRKDIFSRYHKIQKSLKSQESESPEHEITNFLSSFFSQISIPESSNFPESGNPYSSSQTLVPRMGELLAKNGLQPDHLDLVVVALGPGSFTGLRIGVVAAKTFAYATGCNIVGLDLMDAAANQADWLQTLLLDSPSAAGANSSSEDQPVGVAINAGRGDVLATTYERGADSELSLTIEAKIWKPDEWAASLVPGTLITGDGVELISAVEIDGKQLEVIDSTCRMPFLAGLAILGIRRFLDHGPDNHWTMQPIYSRPSSAEEKKQQAKV